MKTTGSVGGKKNKKLPQVSNRNGHVAMEHNGRKVGLVFKIE